MANYPMEFSAIAHGPSGLQSDWVTETKERREVACSIPAEFGGPNTGLSPEDLYLAALTNCYVATLKVIAANSKLEFATIEANGTLILDKDETSAVPWMKQANLRFKVRGVENVDRFRRLMERVSKQCMIINSVKTDVQFSFEIES